MDKLLDFVPPHPLNTAVLFLVFNRLDTTKQVFQAIRCAKPPRVYIAADGAREDRQHEAETVKAVREYILQNIDWDCEVYTLFRDENLGCKYAVSGAISWFFEKEEQGIILEDDCLPSQSFFWYCEQLLEQYKDDDSVYIISGDGRGSGQFDMTESYSFCKYPLIWGWASWASTWEQYDPEISDWPEIKQHLIPKISHRKLTNKFWESTLECIYDKKIDTWDYQLSYLLLKNNAKSIVPKCNLITNIGFGADATHTFDVDSTAANVQNYDIEIPLSGSPDLNVMIEINDFYDEIEFSQLSFCRRAFNKILRVSGLKK